jgi:hypothetical protein
MTAGSYLKVDRKWLVHKVNDYPAIHMRRTSNSVSPVLSGVHVRRTSESVAPVYCVLWHIVDSSSPPTENSLVPDIPFITSLPGRRLSYDVVRSDLHR